MSDADHDAVTVSADDVTVRKTVDTEQFQTLAVVFELISEREETTRVQVVDSVPDAVPIDDIGFHPDYGAEHWSVEDGTVAFERDLAADEVYTTIYGIRDYPEDEIDALLADPELDLLDVGPESLESVLDEDRSDVIRDFISGEADLSDLGDQISIGVDEPEGGEAAETDEEPAAAAASNSQPATADEPEPVETEEPEPEPAAADEPEPVETDEPEPEPAAADEPEPVEADEPEPELAAADEPASADLEPAVTEADDSETEPEGDREVQAPQSGGVVRVLIKELQEGEIDPGHRQLLRDELLDTKGTVEAQVSHLQQRVSNLEAYTDALEEFIDEEGSAQKIIEELRADIRDLEREFRSRDDRLEAALDTMHEQFESAVEDAETARKRSARLSDRFDDVEDDVDDLDDRVSDLRRKLDSHRRELRDDIEALEEDFQTFEEFHERLSSVFGEEGGGAGSSHRGNGE